MSNIIARIASVAAIALAAVPVVAAGSAYAETTVRRINVADIDFSRADHVAKFESRITRAAYALCPVESRQNLAQAAACRQQLRDQAVAKLGAPQRTKLAQTEMQAFNLAAK